MIDFTDEKMVEKYGSWIRVQVAFYDFIFFKASKTCPSHFNENLAEEFMSGGFKDGNDSYEKTIKIIETNYIDPEKLWKEFNVGT